MLLIGKQGHEQPNPWKLGDGCWQHAAGGRHQRPGRQESRAHQAGTEGPKSGWPANSWFPLEMRKFLCWDRDGFPAPGELRPSRSLLPRGGCRTPGRRCATPRVAQSSPNDRELNEGNNDGGGVVAGIAAVQTAMAAGVLGLRGGGLRLSTPRPKFRGRTDLGGRGRSWAPRQGCALAGFALHPAGSGEAELGPGGVPER